jgi:asparagine synthase (glutamine-hydrolysing)
VVRAAFRARLPDQVGQRRGKGSFHGYFTRLYERSRGVLRELLVDGVLATRGLVDGAAVSTYLDKPRPKRDPGFYRLFELVDAELWLRGWGAS